MKHRALGCTGVYVSELCLGTMVFGTQCDDETSRAILNTAADAGITFIDTADGYPLGGTIDTVGQTEEILGRWLQGRRDDYVIATKCHAPMGRRRFQRGLSRRHVFDACDASLRRLQTDFIDLYQVHAFDTFTPLEETLSALDDLVRLGKVRYVGCSNYAAYQVAKARGLSLAHGWAQFVSVQPRYNLLFRQIERELIPLCREDDIGLITYSPLGGGLLTGKHRRGEPTEGTRFTLGTAAELFQRRYWQDDSFAAVEELAAIAADRGTSLASLAVGWVCANPSVTSVIIGASRPEQLADALRAVEEPLDEATKEALDASTSQYRLLDPTGG